MFKQRAFLLLPLMVLLAASLAAQSAGTPATTAAVFTQAATPAAPKGTPLLTYGFDERVRSENWNNNFDYSNLTDDQRKQLRVRTRMWAGLATPNNEARLYVRLTNEFNKRIYPNVRLNMHEVAIDNLYLELNKTFIPGLSVSFGRQEFMRGEGFLFMDGSSGDGSRLTYYNMLDVAYKYKKSKLELVGILDPRMDRFLPLIHTQPQYLNEWDEQAVGLYYTDRNRKNTDVDAYYFLKKEVNDYRAKSNAQFQPDRHINTVGGRVSQRLPNGYSVTGEAALQWGSQHANPTQAMAATTFTAGGGYGYLKKQFTQTKGKPYVLGGLYLLSGSDSMTAGAGFDPLFSRWPKYSELYVYSQVNEKGVAYMTNNRILQVEAGWNPVKPITLRATFYDMEAFHSIAAFNPKIFGTGTHRGENFQTRMDVVVNKNWRGHILYERFDPGKFYAHQDSSFFFRGEISYTFEDKLFSLHKQ